MYDSYIREAPYLEDGVTYVRKLRDVDRRRQERREREWQE